MIHPLAWQDIPGMSDVRLFALQRKIDIVSSNSYLVETPECILLIDPGGLKEQTDLLLAEIQNLRQRKDRLVIICLTHVHLDHCHQVMHHPGLRDLDRSVLAVQESGAIALKARDRKATIADLVQEEVPGAHAEISLFRAADCSGTSRREVQLPGRPCILCSDPIVADGMTIHREILPIGPGQTVEFYHTPGHSPDSICIRIGEYFFIGDLIFATAPGIAGLTGWNREKLIETIDKVSWVLDSQDITLCWPGHGKELDVHAVKRILIAIRNDAIRLEGIGLISPEWASDTAAYADELMAEVERLFTIISGRLVYVAHVLEQLEEGGEAERMRGLLDMALIDDLLSDFNQFSRDFRSGDRLPIQFTLKAGQIVQKLDRLLSIELLGIILDRSLPARASRLLEDFTLTFRGFCPRVERIPLDLVILLNELAESLTPQPDADDDILDAADDEAFTRALVFRIAAINPFEDIAIRMELEGGPLCVEIDRERFNDILTYLMEKIAATGACCIRLAAWHDSERVFLMIGWEGGSKAIAMDGFTMGFARRAVQFCGGRFSALLEGNNPHLLIDLPSYGRLNTQDIYNP